MENVFARLLPLLRSRNWVSRLAAADVIRSIVRHLPTWDPTTSAVTHGATLMCSEVNGFLSLAELRLDRILAQGARLYSMDARELERLSSKTRTGDAVDFASSTVSNEDEAEVMGVRTDCVKAAALQTLMICSEKTVLDAARNGPAKMNWVLVAVLDDRLIARVCCTDSRWLHFDKARILLCSLTFHGFLGDALAELAQCSTSQVTCSVQISS
ncbi:uncharacterized protein DEA37_0013750 [Paragonimus westermani]|uniref:Uncharacterized protein n=1 Tax=Paragonimus westermani TaxID=34504 RepID=A0A5J4N6N6_9TREM|nr:uncharacterized protein DEA37_0013750 [Paragonimus westermani]